MISSELAWASTLVFVLIASGACGGSSSTPGSTSGFAGTYAATFSGTFQNTSPNTTSGTGTSSATITVTNVSSSEIELSWQVAPNPPSGTAYFLMSGSTGKLADAGAAGGSGVATKGSCFTGVIEGNTQTNCCTDCTVSFSGNTMTQPNSGVYSGTTAGGVAYTGTYSGVWTATRQ